MEHFKNLKLELVRYNRDSEKQRFVRVRVWSSSRPKFVQHESTTAFAQTRLGELGVWHFPTDDKPPGAVHPKLCRTWLLTCVDRPGNLSAVLQADYKQLPSIIRRLLLAVWLFGGRVVLELATLVCFPKFGRDLEVVVHRWREQQWQASKLPPSPASSWSRSSPLEGRPLQRRVASTLRLQATSTGTSMGLITIREMRPTVEWATTSIRWTTASLPPSSSFSAFSSASSVSDPSCRKWCRHFLVLALHSYRLSACPSLLYLLWFCCHGESRKSSTPVVFVHLWHKSWFEFYQVEEITNRKKIREFCSGPNWSRADSMTTEYTLELFQNGLCWSQCLGTGTILYV